MYTRRALTLALVLALGITIGECCIGGGGSTGGDSPPSGSGNNNNNQGAGNIGDGSPPPDEGGPLERKLGITNDDVSGYDPSAYANNDEPVTDTSELTCDFTGPCCWNNDANDDADWLIGTETPDEEKFREHFGDYDVVPEAPYLFTGATGESADYKAIFKSCEIKCTASEAVVLFDVYQTENPVVEVCTRPIGGTEPENCQVVQKDPSGIGLAEVPAMPEGGEILIVASNFVDETGDFVIIDRQLEVQALPCDDATDAPPGGSECDITCQFNPDKCGWFDGNELPDEYLPEAYRAGGDKTLVSFVPVDTYNPSGVFPSGPVRDSSQFGDDTSFSSGVIDRSEGAALIYGPINNPEPRIMRVEYFCAFEYNQVALCVEDIEFCLFESEPTGTFADTQWQTAEITVPANTQFVMIIGRRKAGTESESGPLSEVGVANVEWLDENGEPLPECAGQKKKK